MKKEDISITNPDELDKHLQHSSPLTWIILLTVIAVLIGFFAWSLIYKIAVKITGSALVSSGVATLNVDKSSSSKLKEGQKVIVAEQEGLLSFNEESQPIVKGLTLADDEYTYVTYVEMRPFDFLIGK